MKNLRRFLLNEDVPAQALRLKRVMLGAVSYLFTLTLVFVFWYLDLIEGKVVARYIVLIGVVNLGFYLIIRSGWNLRFAEPSLTLVQICVSLPTGVYVMYYVEDARSMLLLLSVSAAVYGLFQFRTRDFIIMTATLLGTYLVLIIAIVAMKPAEVRLQIEIVQLIVLGAAMLQFSALGSYISRLRFNVKDKNQELGKRNIELE